MKLFKDCLPVRHVIAGNAMNVQSFFSSRNFSIISFVQHPRCGMRHRLHAYPDHCSILHMGLLFVTNRTASATLPSPLLWSPALHRRISLSARQLSGIVCGQNAYPAVAVPLHGPSGIPKPTGASRSYSVSAGVMPATAEVLRSADRGTTAAEELMSVERTEAVDDSPISSIDVVREDSQSDNIRDNSRNRELSGISNRYNVYMESHKCCPDDFLRNLRFLFLNRCSDSELLRAMASRFFNSIDDFYPPQILQALHLFSALHYSDESLLAGLVSRIDDVLCQPSTMRLSFMVGLYDRLSFHHPLAVLPVLENLREKVHLLTRELPDLLASFANLHVHDNVLVDGLATQSCLYQGYLQTDFIRAFEAFSRHSYKHDEFENAARTFAYSEPKNITPCDYFRLLAGYSRLKMVSEADSVRATLVRLLRGRGSDSGQLSVLETMKELRLNDSVLLDCFAQELEVVMKGEAFGSKSLPRYMLSLAVLDYKPELPLLVASSPEFAKAIVFMSSKQLCDVLYAIALFLHHRDLSMNRAAQSTAISMVLNAVLAELTLSYRQLSLPSLRKVFDAATYLKGHSQAGAGMSPSSHRFCEVILSMAVNSKLPPSPFFMDHRQFQTDRVGRYEIIQCLPRQHDRVRQREAERPVGPLIFIGESNLYPLFDKPTLEKKGYKDWEEYEVSSSCQAYKPRKLPPVSLQQRLCAEARLMVTSVERLSHEKPCLVAVS
eukprot:GHVQ01039356.1.p1 GENE.GHVQ01039356.1~~GHVQ01039356.1.p1  ORF type:complete len:721 (+),score=60.80 GHVQ01039356.1:3603-5765(+)